MASEEKTHLESIARQLAQSEDYKVLRRVPTLKKASGAKLNDNKLALIVDTETTGLDVREDEIIEIGFILIEYSENGIASVKDFGNELQEPSRKIPEFVQKLTGLTEAKLRGSIIDKSRIREVLSVANIVIAHNASFDRPMCERLCPEFHDKPWACSLTEIDWSDYGFESAKLKYLLLESGYFFEGHRAVDDCAALTHLLKLQESAGKSYFNILMENARQRSFEITVKSPYKLRKDMSSLGYRWQSHSKQAGGFWKKMVLPAELEKEKENLNSVLANGGSYIVDEKDAFSRFR